MKHKSCQNSVKSMKYDLFSGKVGARLPNKKGRRTRWSQAKPEFTKIKVEQKRINAALQYLRMRSVD